MLCSSRILVRLAPILVCILLLPVVTSQVGAAVVARWNLDDGAPATTVSPQVGMVPGTFNPGGNVSWQSGSPPWTNAGEGVIVGPSNQIHFGGSVGDFINFGDDDTFEPDNVTISFLAKAVDTTSSSERILLSKHSNLPGQTGSSWEFGLRTNLEFRLWAESGTEVRVGASCPDPFSRAKFFDGQWHRIVGTHDGSAAKLYVDGNLIEAESLSGNLRAGDGPMYFGHRPWTGSEYPYRDLVGGPLIIHERALTATEVAQLDQVYARWDLDEGSPSSTVSSHVGSIDGDLHGDVTWQSGGPPATNLGEAGLVILSKHLSFGGAAGDYVDLGHHPMMEPDQITIAFWARTTENNAGNTLLGKYSSFPGSYEVAFTSSNLGFRLWTDEGHEVRVGVSASDPFTAAELMDDQWHHIVATHDGSLASLYVDGQLIQSLAASGNVRKTGQPFNLGRRAYPGAEEAFDGQIGGSLLIFNYALNADQVRMLTQVPEPSTAALAIVLLATLGTVRFVRRRGS